VASSAGDWVLKIKALFDGTAFEKGSNDAEAAVKDLATQVDASTEKINQSLKSMDDGVTTTLGSGGTMDRSFTETEGHTEKLAGQFKEELPGAMLDMQDGASSAASGLAMAFSSAGPAGIAVAGMISLAVLLGKSFSSQATKMREAVNTAFQSMEITAKSSLADIRKEFVKSIDQQQYMNDNADYLERTSRATGISYATLTNLLTLRATPATDALKKAAHAAYIEAENHRGAVNSQTLALAAVYDRYQKQVAIQKETVDRGNQLKQALQEQKPEYQENLRLAEKSATLAARQVDTERTHRDIMADANRYAQARANAAERYLTAIRTADAIEKANANNYYGGRTP
jgi:hypothetical protein